VKPLDKVRIEREFDPYDESISTREWIDKRNAQLARRKPTGPTAPALFWLGRLQEFERYRREAWEEKIERPAVDLMLALVNMGDSPGDLAAVRQVIPPLYDISEETDYELVELRNQLRAFWGEISKEQLRMSRRSLQNPFGVTGTFGDNATVAIALDKWWRRYKLDSDGYFIDWQAGTFYPTPKNFRGVIARALVDKSRYLAQCPTCNQYFIKKRDDQKYCLAVTCQRRANTLRQQKFQSTHRKRSARKGKGRA
jgi:hypothetical protein